MAKNIVNSLLFVASIGFSASAAANPSLRDNNILFGYGGAAAAFASARVPSLNELTNTKWMVIGTAVAPDADLAVQSEAGYWPDGKTKSPDIPGYFRTITTYTTQTDAFGHQVLAYAEQYIGAESGKIYENLGPYEASLKAGGVVIDEPYQPATDNMASVCAQSIECRIVQNSGMLLCANTWLHNTSDCKDNHTQPVAYIGYIASH